MTGKQNSNLLYGDNIYKSDASTEPPFFLQILIKVAYIYLKTFFTFFALASISLGLVVIMSGVVAVALTLCLGALLGITRQSQSRKIIPMQIEVVMSHLGTPSFK